MSKTSYFSPAVFRRNVTGYWPMWAIYLAIMLIAVPLTTYTSLRYNSLANLDILYVGVNASLYTGIFFAIAAAMAVFSFMYSTRSANMTASLPIKRGAMFITCIVSMVCVVVCVHLITAVVTILVELSWGRIAIIPILKWLAAGILETLFFVGLASFCAVLTGHILVLPCIYGIFNFAVIGVNALINSVCEIFLYGYTGVVSNTAVWFTPIIKLASSASMLYYTQRAGGEAVYSGWYAILIYTVVSILLTLAALFIYKRRRMELASDVVAVAPLRPIARYCAAVAGSLTLGLLLYLIVYGGGERASAAVFIPCALIGGFFGYFASEMLIAKSFRVFHKWKGFAVYAVLVIAAGLCLQFDPAGYETRVPSPDTVKEATVQLYGRNYTGSDREMIDAVTALHKSIAAKGEDVPDDYDGALLSMYITIDYTFNNGTTMSRQYNTVLTPEELAYFDSPEMRFAGIVSTLPTMADDIYDSVIEYIQDSTWYTLDLTKAQYVQLYKDCILPDIADSSLGSLFQDNQLDVTIGAYINGEYYSLRVTSDAVRTLEYIRDLGIIPDGYNLPQTAQAG